MEAYYVIMTTLAQELVFVQHLLKGNVPLDYPAVILEDNTGVIFLSTNHLVSQHTKHIDLKAHWLRSLIPHTLKVAFVCSDNNYADTGTKNLPGTKQDHFCPSLAQWNDQNPSFYLWWTSRQEQEG